MNTGPTVLVTDDDALFRDAVALTLRDRGYVVITAENAAEGAEVLTRENVDVIVADIAMDGNHRLQWLHDIARVAPGVPVVVVTGCPSMDTAVEAVRLPAVAYLLKPIDARVLCEEVARALSRSATRSDERVSQLLTYHRLAWGLTERQSEVLALLAQGASNKDISAALGCATRTVELHVTAILEKSGNPSRAAIVSAFWRPPRR
jgi:DNA-binding NarL/FixJ family response regulator